MSKIYRVVILPVAFNDLDHIAGYIAKTSPANAAKVIDLLFDAANSLRVFPHRYKVHAYRADEVRSVRSMPVNPFVIYYRIDEARAVVRVLTIRHGHQRRPRKFA